MNRKTDHIFKSIVNICRLFFIPILTCSWCNAAPTFQHGLQSTQKLAFSGGGHAELSGMRAFLTNPACMQISEGHEIQLGLTDIMYHVSPVLLYGQRVSDIVSYGLGYNSYRDQDNESVYHNVKGGFSFGIGPYLTVGTVFFSQYVEQSEKNGFGTDVNVGAIYKFGNYFWTGLSANNIFESEIGEANDGFSSLREFAFGLNMFPVGYVSLYYDYLLEGLEFPNADHVFSLKGKVGKAGKLGIIGSYKIETQGEEESTHSIGIGGQFDTWIQQNLYGISYSITGLPFGFYNTDIIQEISLDARFGLFRDDKAPRISVSDDVGLIKPSASPDSQVVFFKLYVEDEKSPIASWHLAICNTNQKSKAEAIIKSFAGKGMPPKVIKWNGRDSGRELLTPGIYTYRLIVTDKAGNESHTRWQMIEVRE
ncbi:MAG: hypothetical protein HQK83_13690 [Fibrobacteria bacterium]|nr:hypothetical protein [Fibrobacteria bacterium]